MPLSIKVNLRVTGHCNQGGRKYMEDMFSVAYQQTSDDKDLEYAFFGIFDGHGGGEAAAFAKEHLMDIIVKQRNFWSDKDEDVLRAIKDGYINTHYAMWRELDKWPTTASGLPSTAGTTASIAFIRKGKIYIGHVGDSAIILGYQEEGDPQWKARALTKDHKPESGPEMIRIKESGGKVVSKSGVPRVVWNRPRIGHKGPVRRSTHIDEIPFLAVARSLGDLWSYNSELDTFVVSPEPDVKVVTVDVKTQRCLIFGTDGLWNMLTPQAAVAIVQSAEKHNEKHIIASQQTGHGQGDVQMWINPSKSLVDTALERWFSTRLRADNTSVVTLMLDPPGPSRSEVIMSRKNENVGTLKNVVTPIPRAFMPIVPPEEIVETSKPSANPGDDELKPKQPDTSDLSCTKSMMESNVAEDFKATNEVPEIETNVASTSVESIQVAEISSSDAFDETPKLVIEDTSDDVAESTNALEKDVVCENFERNVTDSMLELIREVTPDVNDVASDSTSPERSPAAKDMPEDGGMSVLIRQNGFYGTCEELQSGSRLRREFSGSYSSVNRSASQEQKHEKKEMVSVVGIPTRRQSGSLGSHLESRSVRCRQSVNGASYLGERPKSYYASASRLKRESLAMSRDRKMEIVEEKRISSPARSSEAIATTTTTIVGSKRRHSSTADHAEEPKHSVVVPEPSTKRRTRSEDRPGPTDENDPSNQEKQQHSRLRWPEDSSSPAKSRSVSGPSGATGSSLAGGQEKISPANSFQRRSLEKKATPVKTIKRPSINGCSGRPQLRGSFALREWDQAKSGHRSGCSPRTRLNRSVSSVVMGSTNDASPAVPSLQRWLRSDTLAATPVKTLRSRNVDIDGHTIPAQLAHQYGIVKPNRLSLPAKMKLAAKVSKPPSTPSTPSPSSSANLNGKLTKRSISPVSATTNGAGGNASTVITKRVKSPYNASTRSALGTRSRFKRLGK